MWSLAIFSLLLSVNTAIGLILQSNLSPNSVCRASSLSRINSKLYSFSSEEMNAEVSSLNVFSKTKLEEVHQQLLLGSVSLYTMLPVEDVHAASEGKSMMLSIGRPVLDTFVNVLSLLMLCRTVLSWYPKTNLNEFPYSIVAWPTEPLLIPVRSIIPPAFGVDVSALVYVAVLSFIRETLTGQQGILTLMEKYQDVN
jgi:YggT family protein